MVRFFVHPIFAFGHYQTATTLGQQLIKRGHEVILFANEFFECRLRKNESTKGFQYLRPQTEPNNFQVLLDMLETFKLDQYEDHIQYNQAIYTVLCEENQRFDKEIEHILETLKPDVVITDQVVSIPRYIAAKVPWIQIISMNILSYGHIQLPTRELGLPVEHADNALNKRINNLYENAMDHVFKTLNSDHEKLGLKRKRCFSTFEESDFLNIYCKPRELDYFENPKEWGNNFARFESLIRTEVIHDPLPLDLNSIQHLPGKLVYLGMGTLVTTQAGTMQKILNKIGRVKHRFIVTVGVVGDQLSLPDNCIGASFLPQTHVLQMVDAFVSHGGNNGVQEALHYGVPMVILPAFMDQLDNARRFEEKGLGKRLCLHDFTSEQMQEALDDLFSDRQRLNQIKAISRRLQQSNNVVEACDLIERRLQEIGFSADKENATIN